MRKSAFPGILLPAALCLLILARGAPAQEAGSWFLADQIDPERLDQEIETAAGASKALADSDWGAASRLLGGAPINEKSAEDWKKAVSERQVALSGVKRLQAESSQLRALDVKEMATRTERLVERRETASKEPARPVPRYVTEEQLKREEADLKEKESTARAALSAVEARRKNRITEETLAKARTRSGEIQKILSNWGQEATDPLPGYQRQTLEIEQSQIARYLEFAKAADPIQKAQIELLDADEALADVIRKRQSDYVEGLRKEYSVLQKNALVRLQRQAEEKKRAIESEADPAAKLSLELELRVLEVRIGGKEDEARLGRAKIRNSEFRDYLDGHKKTLQSLRDLASTRYSNRTKKLLVATYESVKVDHAELARTWLPGVRSETEKLLADSADVADLMSEEEEAAGSDELEKARKDRLKTLDEAIVVQRDTAALLGEIESALEELYRILIREVFWLRSADTIGLDTFRGLPDDFRGIIAANVERDTLGRIDEARHEDPVRFFAFLGGALLLVLCGLFLGRRLRRHQTRWNYRGSPLVQALERLGAAVLVSVAAPAFFLLAVLLLSASGLPPVAEDAARVLLIGTAAALFLRRFLWVLFREDGIAVKELGADPAAAEELLRVGRWAVMGLLFLLLPLLIVENFHGRETGLDRILSICTYAWFGFLVSRLSRRKGPFLLSLTGGKGFWHGLWFLVNPVIHIVLLAAILMEVLGYRFGARTLFEDLIQTLLVLFLLVGLYNLVTGIVRKGASRMRSVMSREVGWKEAQKETEEAIAAASQFVAVLVFVAAALFLLDFWGFNDSISAVLGKTNLIELDAAKGVHITVLDVLMAIVWIVAGQFVIAHLGGLYELLLYPKLAGTDRGTRYVVYAISKYAILFISWAGAFLTLHLSLSSLGYIFAALSFGIGFGLQEIVSNFIAGLILFVERPVRVGDIVSVGTAVGTVDSISIRATQLINWDRQVIIIPNRKFITEEVVNWAHNDEIVRSTIEVGVAYGTDAEKVTAILLEMLRADERVLTKPAPVVWFTAFGDSSLKFRVHPYSKITGRLDMLHDLRIGICRRFAEEGITIPLPQRDVHIRSLEGEPPIGLPPTPRDGIRDADELGG